MRTAVGSALLSIAHWLRAICLLVAAIAIVGAVLPLAFLAVGGHASSGHDAAQTIRTAGFVIGATAVIAVVGGGAIRRLGIRVLPALHGEVVGIGSAASLPPPRRPLPPAPW
jgi:hypothetical protein